MLDVPASTAINAELVNSQLNADSSAVLPKEDTHRGIQLTISRHLVSIRDALGNLLCLPADTAGRCGSQLAYKIWQPCVHLSHTLRCF